MKLLLDTHIWIWALIEPAQLHSRVRHALTAADNQFWLSPVSIWELLTLVRKGRLSIPTDPYTWVQDALQQLALREAAVTNEIAIASQRLSLTHWDPADRFIAATAIVNGLTLVTADRRLLACKELATLANS